MDPSAPPLPCRLRPWWLAALWLAGCAAAAPDPVNWPLLGRATDDHVDAQALAAQVQRVAAVPLSEPPHAVAPGWFAFSLRCDTRVDCKRATMKLAAEPSLFVELRRDDTRHIPTSPSASLSR